MRDQDQPRPPSVGRRASVFHRNFGVNRNVLVDGERDFGPHQFAGFTAVERINADRHSLWREFLVAHLNPEGGSPRLFDRRIQREGILAPGDFGFEAEAGLGSLFGIDRQPSAVLKDEIRSLQVKLVGWERDRARYR